MINTPLIKVIVAGDGNVGKTSLIRLYTEGKFEISRIATIGVDFYVHTVQLPDGPVRLSIWDMAGQKQFQFFRSDFYRGSLAAALVYDVTVPETLEHLAEWHEEIIKINPDQKFIVVGNKIDLERSIQPETAQSFARIIKSHYLETSALSSQGVTNLFFQLALLAMMNFE